MLHQHVCIPNARWCVDIYYDARPKDADYILGQLHVLGCAEEYLYKAEEILTNGLTNEGLTYSNIHKRKTIIVIERADDVFELLNSIGHEKMHLQMAICRADGLDPYGEEIAYISGDISSALAHNAWYMAKKIFLKLV